MQSSTLDILERYGATGELIYENAIQRLLRGRASVEEAMDYIMEFARGSWTLVVDENLESLADALAELNYAVRLVPKGLTDDQIRQKYGDRGVFITADTVDFSLNEVPDPFEDGMILVPNGIDEAGPARAIEQILMNWRKQHKAAPVQFRINRGDV